VKKFDEFIIAIIYVIFSINLLFRLVSFKWREEGILEIIDDFDELADKFDSVAVKERVARITTIVKMLLLVDFSAGTVMGIAILLFSKNKFFLVPLLYSAESDWGYYVLFAFHYIQAYGLGTSLNALESIFTASQLLLEVYIDCLSEKMANINDLKSLKECVRIHNQLRR
jgi:hypothetical protein